MEGSPAQFNMRSISLPSRLNPNPFKIKTWETSLVSRTATSLEIIQTGLVGLVESYNSLDELIQSPLTRKALPQHRHRAPVEEALEGSVGLLDSCAIIGDLLRMMKERVQDIQSGLRRKGGDSSIGNDISAYICFRKKVKKDVAKSLKDIQSRVSLLNIHV